MHSFQSDPGMQRRRKQLNELFRATCILAASLVVVILIVLISTVLYSAYSGITLTTGAPILVNDEGISSFDRITNDSRLHFEILKQTGPQDSTASIWLKNESTEPRKIGTGNVKADGSYDIKCQSVSDGNYLAWFEVYDASGQLVITSAESEITVDTAPPEGISIDRSTLGDQVLVESELSEFVIGGGGVSPGGKVIVTVQDSFGNSVGPLTARIKKDGQWRISKTRLGNLLQKDGDRVQTDTLKVAAYQMDRAGNQEKPVSISLAVDLTTQTAADLVTDFADDDVDLTPVEQNSSPPTNLKTFLTSYHHDSAPENSGIRAAIIGSVYLCLVCAIFTIPIGVGTAIFMEDFKPANRVLRGIHSFIQLNINNLAGVPSIVYGILGVTVFVYMFSLFPPAKANQPAQIEFGTNYFYQLETLGGNIVRLECEDKYQTTIEINESMSATSGGKPMELQVVDSTSGLTEEQRAVSVRRGKKASIVTSEHHWYYFALPFGKGFLAAGLTLGLVVLPIIVIASQEAIRAVPSSLREASYGLGATRWQTVQKIVIPSATPGIMTGTILALSRAIGEAAPILAVMGGIISNVGGPDNLMDNCTALPIIIYKWAKDAMTGFHNLSAAAIVVLLLLLLLLNSVAIVIRYRSEKQFK